MAEREKLTWGLLYGLALFVIVLAFGSNALMARYSYFEPQLAGDIQTLFMPSQGNGPQHFIVQDITPSSPLYAAGVRKGDAVQLDHAWDELRMPEAGERFGLTRLDTGQKISIVLSPSTAAAANNNIVMTMALWSNISLFLVGIVVLWRCRRDMVLYLLAMAMLAMAVAAPYKWPMPPPAYPVVHSLILPCFRLSPWLCLLFSMAYYSRNTRPLGRGEWVAVGLMLAAQTVAVVVETVISLLNYGLPMASFVFVALQVLGVAATVRVLVLGYLRSQPEFRDRYILILVALSLVLVGYVSYLFETVFNFFHIQRASATLILDYIAGFAGPVLFGYAVLRHKVLDLGFAINRTLVYTVVSAILLIAFGLIEWASDKFIPLGSREKNLVVDACVALGIFLTFHRLRDFVEAMVEKLLFRTWHEKEAQLKRFTREAQFVTRPDALMAAFVAALSRFGEGAQAALYLKGEDGDFARAEGVVTGAPAAIIADHPALVSLRSERKAMALDGELGGGLIVPMLNRNEVTGVALLGSKPSGTVYRPDEIEALSHSTGQVGLDLHALEVERLQAESASQRQENTLLAVEVDTLRRALAGRLAT